jgi:hypothetical protein
VSIEYISQSIIVPHTLKRSAILLASQGLVKSLEVIEPTNMAQEPGQAPAVPEPVPLLHFALFMTVRSPGQRLSSEE